MKPQKHFEFRSFKWHCSACFYADHVEHSWDEWGLGVRKGKRTVLKEQLQTTLGESNTFGYQATGSFIRVAQFVIVAAGIWLFVPDKWKVLMWLPIALAILPLVVGLRRLRKGHWLNLQTKEGYVAFGIDVSTWQPSEIVELQEFYAQWMKDPGQQPEKIGTSGSL